MKSNIRYIRENISLSNGSHGKTIDTQAFEEGVVVGVYVIPTKNINPEQIIEISVQDYSQGSGILNFTDIRDYFHKGGGYFQGIKPVNFPTNRQRFKIVVQSSEALTEDVKFQIIFVLASEQNVINQ